MKNPALLFFQNRHLLVLTALMILVGGAAALFSLPRLEDPILTNRYPQVTTVYPGATAERVEALVTDVIEEQLNEVPEIKKIDSTSASGVSIIAIELREDIGAGQIEEVFSKIRDRLAEASQQFPAGVGTPSFDDKKNPVAFSMILRVLWPEGGDQGIGVIGRQAEELADRLRNLPGTEVVRLYGAPEEEVVVSLDPTESVALGLTPVDVAEAISNADAKAPAGSISGVTTDADLEVSGAIESLERIRRIPLAETASGRVVRLADVASVLKGVASPATSIALCEGNRVDYVAARALPGVQIDQWAIAANEVISSFRQGLGTSLLVEEVFVQSDYTSERLGDLAFNLGLGVVLVVGVILSVMGWRASLVVGAAIPLTAGFTLFALSLLGGGLHQMSIFGMIIALGLLIDNAIVVTDEVMKNLQTGMERGQAVARAVQHLFFPLVSSTLTTVLAFMPIVLLPGSSGDFVRSIGISVVLALIGSLFIALTIIASLAGIYLRRGGQNQETPEKPSQGGRLRNRLQALVRHTVRRAILHPILTILLAVAVSGSGFYLATTLGSEFFPRTDRDMFEVKFWLPADRSLAETRRVAEELEQTILGMEGAEGVHWLLGGSFPAVYYNQLMNKEFSNSYGHGVVQTQDFHATDRMVSMLQRELERSVPEAQVVVSKFAQGPPAEAAVELRISGPEINLLQEYGEEVRHVLSEQRGILQTRSSMPLGHPQFKANIDEDLSRAAGLDLGAVSSQLESLFRGHVGGLLLEGTQELPVRVRLPASRRDGVSDFLDANFLKVGGGWVPFSAVGELEVVSRTSSITRRNGIRTNTIYGYSDGVELPIEITNAALIKLEQSGFALAEGYSIELGGDSENQGTAVGNLMVYLPVIIVATLATLILAFRSVRIAGILLVVAPLSVGVGMIASWVAGYPLSFNSILGSMGLMGLAFNSSIVVIAAIRADTRARSGDVEHMVAAVTGSVRHLLSTTLTTIGSFVPLLIFIGGQFWPPLAVVLAGGVGGSTLLALLFTPAAYVLLFRLAPAKSRAQMVITTRLITPEPKPAGHNPA